MVLLFTLSLLKRTRSRDFCLHGKELESEMAFASPAKDLAYDPASYNSNEFWKCLRTVPHMRYYGQMDIPDDLSAFCPPSWFSGAITAWISSLHNSKP